MEDDMIKLPMIAVAVAAMAAAANADAATFYSNTTPTGELGTPGSVSYNFAGPSRTGRVSFELAGYRTLDGVNCCTDTIDVELNGTLLLSASYNLGGGGVNTVYSGSPVVTFYSSGSPAVYNGTANGGLIDITLNGAAFAASNVVKFSYSGSGQGVPDEAFGINRVSAAVPEPAAWTLMIAGFGLVGAASRRRQAIIAA